MASVSFILRLLFATVVRFFRFFPNNDPVLGVALPSARKNLWSGILFAIIAMVSFDIITGKVGIWTLVTSATYAFVILVLGLVFSKMKHVSIKHYLFASIAGVLIFDAITGPLMSTFIFKQSLFITIMGQIPFTFYHLASTSTYSLVFAFLLDKDVRIEVLKGISKYHIFMPLRQVVLGFDRWL
jgi:hypothetical protein